MTIGSRVLRAAFANAAAKLIAFVVAFALMPFLLHNLGEEKFGLWILVSSVLGYGAVLDLGIADAVTKYVAEYHARREPGRANDVVSAALVLYSGLGILALLLSILLAYASDAIFVFSASDRSIAVALVLILGAQLAISIPCAVFPAILRGLQQYGLLNAVAVVCQLVTAAATVAVVLTGGSVVEVVGTGAVLSLGTQIALAACVRHIAPDVRFRWHAVRKEHMRSVLVFSLSMFAMHAAGRVQTKSDEVVIGIFLSASAVAPYAMARRLSAVPQMIAEQFLKIFVPLASQLHAENDWHRLRALYLVGTRLTLAILMPLAGALIALAAPTLTFWIGPEYAQYSLIVVLLALASVVETSQWPAMSILQGMATHHRLARAWVCCGIANLALSVALVRPYGVVGVAIGTLVPHIAVCIGFILPHAARTIEVSVQDLVREVFLPALAPAVPMSAGLLAMNWLIEAHSPLSALVAAALAIAIYAAGYLCLARHFERRMIRRVARSAVRIAAWRSTYS